jgi:hypothetical protein
VQKSYYQSTKLGDYAASFAGRATHLTIEACKRLQKRVAYNARLDSNDVAATDRLVLHVLPAMGSNNPVLHYQGQERGADGTITKHLELVLGDPFGLKMLEAAGAGPNRMVLLDATGGTNVYGYQLHVLLVVDDYREGVPCVFMITSDQEASAVCTLLKVWRTHGTTCALLFYRQTSNSSLQACLDSCFGITHCSQ